jgi:hypothetical protein
MAHSASNIPATTCGHSDDSHMLLGAERLGTIGGRAMHGSNWRSKMLLVCVAG